MDLTKVVKIVTAVATVVITLGCAFLAVWGLTIPSFPLSGISALMGAGFGYLSYSDYKYFFGSNNASNK